MLDYSKKRNIEDRKQDTEREKDESQKIYFWSIFNKRAPVLGLTCSEEKKEFRHSI